MNVIKPTTSEYNIIANVKKNIVFIFVSDLHGCENEPIYEVLRSVRHDAILVGGDFVHDEKNYKKGIEFLKTVSESEKCFVCLGNHDSCFPSDIRKAVKDCGATLLDNSYVDFNGIKLAGFTSGEFYMPGKIPNLKWLEGFASLDGFKLLLCHRPEYFKKYIKKFDVDLTISGHAHGGQWRVFGHGIYAPGQGIFPKYTSGLYENRLIVSRGLGNPHIIPRINNTPEILVINIIPKSLNTEENK